MRSQADRLAESRDLKRYMDAAKGRPLSWGPAIEMRSLIGAEYSGGDKLSAGDRAKLQVHIDTLLARGVVPATSLLTECQKKAQRRRA